MPDNKIRRRLFHGFLDLVGSLVDLFGPQTEMADIEGTLAWVRDAGYEIVGHFTLPDDSWWRTRAGQV